MKFGGIGVPELLIILVVVLLIFGPKNLPKLGSALGRSVKNLRDGMESAPDIEIDEDDEVVDEDGKTEEKSKKKAKKKKRIESVEDDGEKPSEEK